jgi:hypothetical protein
MSYGPHCVCEIEWVRQLWMKMINWADWRLGNHSRWAGLKEKADVAFGEWSPRKKLNHRKKEDTDHSKVMLQAQPLEERKGDTPLGCSGRNSLKKGAV